MVRFPATPVVAPTPTPFAGDDSVDFGALERNVARWLDTPLTGFVLNSENGEETFLSESEKLQIIRCVRDVVDGAAILMAGIDCPSVTESLRLAEACVEHGANYIRLRIPRLVKSIPQYLCHVIERCPVPVMIIHQPAPGLFLTAGAMELVTSDAIRDAVCLDNCAGYIASANLRIEAHIRTVIPENRQFWTGNGSLLTAGAAIGATGACLMLGNVAPAECRVVLQLFSDGRLSDAITIQQRLIEADFEILSRQAAGLKVALDLLGFAGGNPRLPSLPCDAEAVDCIRRALVRAQLL